MHSVQISQAEKYTIFQRKNIWRKYMIITHLEQLRDANCRKVRVTLCHSCLPPITPPGGGDTHTHTHTHRLEGRECRSQMLLLRGCHCRQPGCAHGVDFSGPDNGTLPGASQCFLWHHHKPGGPSPTRWNILGLVQTFEEVPWFPSQIF